MREIKFRGKVLYNGNHYFSGDWVIGFYLENEKGESFIVDTEPDELGNARFQTVQVDPKTVGQYTGLKDKNGKEIYEGDIIHSDHGGKHFWVYEIKSIGGQFGNCLFAILIKDNLTSDEDDNYYIYEETTKRAGDRSFVPSGKGIEIVGNIYERES